MANTGHSEPTLLTIGEKWPGGDAAFSYWGLSGRAELGAAGLPLLRAFALHSSCGIRERAVPAARPRIPNHTDLHTSPAARPDGSLAAVQGPGQFGWRYLGWAMAGPPSLGSSRCHMGASLLSPYLCC